MSPGETSYEKKIREMNKALKNQIRNTDPDEEENQNLQVLD